MFKFIIELLPVVAFFVGYRMNGIFTATIYTLIVSVISIGIIYIKERKISYANLISFVLLMLSGSLTLLSGNTQFIKMKPTILYILFAFTFVITQFKWTPAVKFLLGSAIKFEYNKYWYILNRRFAYFFILMAIANEIVWRNFSESMWVNFKLFGAAPLSIIFIFMQMPFIMRNKINNEL